MSIVNEALKKAAKEERWVPQAEVRKFTFSARFLSRKRIVIVSASSIFLILIIISFLINLTPGLLFKTTVKVDIPVTNKIPNVPEKNPVDKKKDASKIWEEASRLNQKGLELYRSKKFNEAREAFAKAINIKPDYAIALNNLGLVYMEEGKEREAETNYRNALKADQNYPEAMNNLGLLYTKEGNYEEAIRLFRGALKVKTDYPDAHLNLAILLERSGYFTEAKNHYNNFIEYAPKERQSAVLKVKNHIANLL